MKLDVNWCLYIYFFHIEDSVSQVIAWTFLVMLSLQIYVIELYGYVLYEYGFNVIHISEGFRNELFFIISSFLM